jgi:thiol-disulfide isomerase/thioredoxin
MRQISGAEMWKEVRGRGKVVVVFTTKSCAPCKKMEPQIDQLSDELGIPFLKLDAEENMNLAESFGISSVPTFVMFENYDVKIVLPTSSIEEVRKYVY